MTGKLSIVCLLLGGLPGALAGAAESPDPAPDSNVLIRNCELQYLQSSTVGTSLAGILQDCLVRAGDRVRAGQVLGRLQDQDVRAEMDLRAAEAQSDVGIRLSQAKFDQAVAKLRASTVLRQKNFTSEEQYNLDKLDADSAALELEEARHRHELAQIQLRQAEASVRLREIVSPHDGIVAAVYKQPGESVSLNDAKTTLSIFRVVDVDRLRVTGRIDVVDAWRVQAGQPVRVWADVGGADLPIEREEFTGRVSFVDPEVQSEDQTCTVLAEVDNRSGLLRAGLPARMEIHVGDAPSSSPVPPAAPRAGN